MNKTNKIAIAAAFAMAVSAQAAPQFGTWRLDDNGGSVGSGGYWYGYDDSKESGSDGIGGCSSTDFPVRSDSEDLVSGPWQDKGGEIAYSFNDDCTYLYRFAGVGFNWFNNPVDKNTKLMIKDEGDPTGGASSITIKYSLQADDGVRCYVDLASDPSVTANDNYMARMPSGDHLAGKTFDFEYNFARDGWGPPSSWNTAWQNSEGFKFKCEAGNPAQVGAKQATLIIREISFGNGGGGPGPSQCPPGFTGTPPNCVPGGSGGPTQITSYEEYLEWVVGKPAGVEDVWGYFESNRDADWSISSGELPPGIRLEHNSYSTYNSLVGTPTKAGTYDFTVKATAPMPFGSSEVHVSIKINSEDTPYFFLSPLVNGTWGEPYSHQFRAYGYHTGEDITNKVRWSITSGSLPPGLALNANNGTISGTPTGAGNYDFTIKAENSAGLAERQTRINIENVAPEILAASVPKGEVGALYNVSLQSKGSVTWSIASGSLPSGLRLNADTGIISGMPESGTDGDYTFEVEATNEKGSDTEEFAMTVEAMKPAAITTETLAKGTVGSTYYGRISSTSYLATFSKTGGELPDGLELNPSGTFSGAPTKAGTYTFKVKAANEKGSDPERGEKEFTLIVEEAPIVDDGSPILPQIAVAKGGNARAYAQGSAIVLENLPQNSKVEVYSLKGRQVYSGNSENSQTLRILVQSKGVYVVKANKAAYRISVR
ncbi:MAG: putative Ig domain-containing protein [Fibromonadaceae bacterium]|nr:putative Ig domain-containing protein [Fibromonadaceae bacterium]